MRDMRPACTAALSCQLPPQRFIVKSSPPSLRLDRQPPPHKFAVGPAPQPQPNIMLAESDTPRNRFNP